MQQHYHQLLCAARSSLGVNVSSHPHSTHSSICVGQSFLTLPSFGCQQTPAIPLSLRAQHKQSVAGEEKSGILYVHIYLPAAGLLQLAGFPPAPKSSSSSFPGRVHWRVDRDGLQRGGCKMGRPHQTRGRRMASFSTCYETTPPCGLRSFRATHFQASAARCSPFPFEVGETVKLRPSVSQIQANALLQQFEANLALGFPG